MATASVAKTFDLATSERDLVVRALATHHALVKRSINSERDASVKEIRQRELDAVDALSLRFR